MQGQVIFPRSNQFSKAMSNFQVHVIFPRSIQFSNVKLIFKSHVSFQGQVNCINDLMMFGLFLIQLDLPKANMVTQNSQYQIWGDAFTRSISEIVVFFCSTKY